MQFRIEGSGFRVYRSRLWLHVVQEDFGPRYDCDGIHDRVVLVPGLGFRV